MSEYKIDINKEFDELFEEFKSVHKLPERKKISSERIRQLENEYCETVYGRDFVEWREKRQERRYHTSKHTIRCDCGEEYTLHLEPETIDIFSYDNLISSEEEYVPTMHLEYHVFYCPKCGRMLRYTGKLKHISSERGNFKME